MDFGQWSALCVLVGIVVTAVFAQYVNNDTQHVALQPPAWKRGAAYFGIGVLCFGLVSCVLVAAGISLSFS